MGLFGGFQNAGPGINPYAPKKKPFFRFWELLWRNLGKLLTLNIVITLMHAPVLLSMMFYIRKHNNLTVPMCIFLLIVQFFVMGPTYAASARVLRLIVLDKAFFFGQEFKKGFTRNFGAATLYWILNSIVLMSIYAGFQVYPELSQKLGTKLVFVPQALTMGVGLVLLFMNNYIWTLQAATTLKKKSVLKNSLMLSALSVKRCLLSFFLILAVLGICLLIWMVSSYLIFLFAFFPAAFIGYIVTFIHYPVVQKYVINPYYEDTGEENPEAEPEIPEDQRVFTDRGGTEKPVKQEKKKGKVIS